MIRVLEKSDAGALARFFERNNRPEVTRGFHPFALDAESARRICEDGPPDWYFAYLEDAVIRGFGMLRGWREGFAIPSFGLLVDYESGGKGIGSLLTAYANGLAKGLRCASIRLTVHQENAAAMRVYARSGLRFTKKMPRLCGCMPAPGSKRPRRSAMVVRS
jgi:ribosomal protein S18 acetylase RimI-like enzyme